MQNYKDLNNKIHAIDADKFEYLLPQGCVKITQAEADILQQAPALTVEQSRALLRPLSPAQVRLVLDQFGLLTQVESAVALGNKKLKVEWEFRTEFARNNAVLMSMASALGITDAQLDQMFSIGITL